VGRVLLRILFWAAITVATLLAVIIVALAVGIPVSLEPLREPVAAAASQALGRRVSIAGPVKLVPAFRPTVEIQGLRIANPPDWPEGELAHLELARLQIGVLPLLWRRATVNEMRVEGGALRLEIDAHGAENWRFMPAPAAQDKTEPGGPESAGERVRQALREARAGWIRNLELTELVLRDIRVERRDARTDGEESFVIDELTGSAATDAPIDFDARGSLLDHPYRLEMDGGPLLGLFVAQDEPWPLALSLEIAETRLRLRALIDEPLLGPERLEKLSEGEGRVGAFEIEIAGQRLSSLDTFARVKLPDWGPWAFGGRFAAFKGGRQGTEVKLTVGGTDLSGTMVVELQRKPPHFDVTLTADTIQLDDFALGDWSPTAGGKVPAEAEARTEAEEAAPARQTQALLSAETLGRLDAELSVEIGRVLSGSDRLGASVLEAKLEQGRLSVQPWHVEVPGGALEVTAALHPTRDEMRTDLAARVERFDYGILARRFDPETDVSGLLTLDLALFSRAPKGERIMPHANGHLDVGLFPESFEADVIDLWAVNLVMAVLPLVDSGEGSILNCLVASLDIEDGIMKERSILMDTSRMRVSGEATVDFHEQRIRARLKPRAKRPQFFSLATPVRVNGSFDDFGVRLRPGVLLGTVIRLAASPVEVPVRHLIRDTLPEDGTPDCRAALERIDR
jgi:uncharacterized protein involved in outer membrane biogenesis